LSIEQCIAFLIEFCAIIEKTIEGFLEKNVQFNAVIVNSYGIIV